MFVGEYSRWSDERVGPARIGWVLPTRNLLESGAKVAFGTDYTASDSGDRIATLSGAVARQSLDGQPPAGWHNDQRIDVD